MDPAERVIQVHAVDVAGRVLVGRALARDKFVPCVHGRLAAYVCLGKVIMHACKPLERPVLRYAVTISNNP